MCFACFTFNCVHFCRLIIISSRARFVVNLSMRAFPLYRPLSFLTMFTSDLKAWYDNRTRSGTSVNASLAGDRNGPVNFCWCERKHERGRTSGTGPEPNRNRCEHGLVKIPHPHIHNVIFVLCFCYRTSRVQLYNRPDRMTPCRSLLIVCCVSMMISTTRKCAN